MTKQADPGKDNSITRLPIPMIGDINNRRFVTAVLSGILGGAGVGAAAGLLRTYRSMREKKTTDTDDKTIVLTLPAKEAADGYTGMRDAVPGEHKVTAKGGTQFRDRGRYSKRISKDPDSTTAIEKKADQGNPGPNSVGTVVLNTLGLAAGGLMSYEVVSRLFDAMEERRLKRKLRAAQQAYVDAMSGVSKRAEAVLKVLDPVEHVVVREPLEKSADIFGSLTDMLPDSVTNTVRYPTAAYILALLAGTGATAYITKKVMDREFPEEKLKEDLNKPTRIVFRTAGGKPALLEGPAGTEKQASADTCAALTAMLPIYMDIVEGKPNRTLAAPYVKIAESAGTDPAGLMKMAQLDMSAAYKTVLRDPRALWEILKGTRFGLDFNKANAVGVLRRTRPETYRRAVDAAIDSHFAGGPGDGIFRKGWNSIARTAVKGFAGLGGRDWLVNRAVKSAGLLGIPDTGDVLAALASSDKTEDNALTPVDERAVLKQVKARLKGRRGVSIEAQDAVAARYIRKNKAAVRKVLARLNARGVI